MGKVQDVTQDTQLEQRTADDSSNNRVIAASSCVDYEDHEKDSQNGDDTSKRRWCQMPRLQWYPQPSTYGTSSSNIGNDTSSTNSGSIPHSPTTRISKDEEATITIDAQMI